MKEKSLWMSIIRVNKVHLDYICFAFFLILSISSDICLISGPLLRRQYQVFLEKKKSNGFWDWFAHAYVYLVSTFYTHKAPCMHVCICEGHVGVLMEQIYVGRQMQSKMCWGKLTNDSNNVSKQVFPWQSVEPSLQGTSKTVILVANWL